MDWWIWFASFVPVGKSVKFFCCCKNRGISRVFWTVFQQGLKLRDDYGIDNLKSNRFKNNLRPHAWEVCPARRWSGSGPAYLNTFIKWDFTNKNPTAIMHIGRCGQLRLLSYKTCRKKIYFRCWSYLGEVKQFWKLCFREKKETNIGLSNNMFPRKKKKYR